MRNGGLAAVTATIIAGAGYLGARFAQRLAGRGEVVFAIRRDAGDGRAAATSDVFSVSDGEPGIVWITANLSAPTGSLVENLRANTPRGKRVDRMLVSISPGGRDAGPSRERHNVAFPPRGGRDAEATRPESERLSPESPDLDGITLVDPFPSAVSLADPFFAAIALTDPFLAAIRETVRLARALEVSRVVYTSSTGVYSESHGGVVDESSPVSAIPSVTPAAPDSAERIAPTLERVSRLVMAEHIVRSGLGARAIIARLSGLYGPGRNPIPRYERGDQSRTLGEEWTNRVHVDDAVAAIDLLLTMNVHGTVVNVSDDKPARAAEIAQWIWEMRKRQDPGLRDGPAVRSAEASLGMSRDAEIREAGPNEVSGHEDQSDSRGSPRRGEAGLNKRVSNARLRGLGWTPGFPSYREGFREFL
jgi:nucleoside-diphosphate-sugar epimerase